MTKVKIKNLTSSKKTYKIDIPGSKSYSNRTLLIAGFTEGKTQISNILKSDDTYWCIKALRKLGIDIEENDKELIVHGKRLEQIKTHKSLYVGSAGTTARFLTAILAFHPNADFKITASEQMSKRPMRTLIDALNEKGAKVKLLSKNSFPLSISKPNIKNSPMKIAGNRSSQFLSAAFLAISLAKLKSNIEVTTNIVQSDYLDITLDLLKKYGVKIEAKDKIFKIDGSNLTSLESDFIEIDVSSASYFIALACLHKLKLKIKNYPKKTLQPDSNFLKLMENFNLKYVFESDGILLDGGEVVFLNHDRVYDLNAYSDQALTLCSLAPQFNSSITIKNVEHIRSHESDRISAFTHILNLIGIENNELIDGWTVYPNKSFNLKNPIHIPTYEDHRICMSASILASQNNNIILEDIECVSKTFPNYFEVLSKVGFQIEKY